MSTNQSPHTAVGRSATVKHWIWWWIPRPLQVTWLSAGTH